MTIERMPVAQHNDADLVSESLGGHRDAFARIIERYQSLICSLAYCATGRLTQSEDLAQETFVTAWKHLPELREPAKLRPWLCGIARCLIGKALRRDAREPAHGAAPLEEIEESAAAEPLPLERVISQEEQAILWRSIQRIPEIYREPLVLFYREHQSVADVATALDLTEDTVKQRLSRGRKLLEEQVLAFVEGALESTRPSKAFTLGVVAVLPLFATTSSAAAASVATAKGGSAAKAAGGVGTLAALLSWGVICFLSVLGFLGFLGGCLGYAMARAARQSSRQCSHIVRFWRTLAIGFAAFVVPVLLPTWLVLKEDSSPGLWRAMSWWLGLMYPLLLAALAVWTWRWWRDLPGSEPEPIESGTTPRKQVATWVALGTAVPAVLFVASVFGIFFGSIWQDELLPAAEAEKMIVERKDATFSVSVREGGSRTLCIKLPEKSRLFRFSAPADDRTLELLTRNGVAYTTHVEGRGLGKSAMLLMLLSAFFLAPAGAILLLLQLKAGMTAALEPAALAKFTRKRSRFDEILLVFRTEPTLRKTFCWVFGAVFLVVFGAGAFLAFLPGNRYVSTARVMIEVAGPQAMREELAAAQSGAVLGAVAEKRDWDVRLGQTYNHGRALTPDQALDLLRRIVVFKADAKTGEISIEAQDPNRAQAASLANAIATVYCEQRTENQQVAQLRERATPALRPVPNNRSVLLTLAGATAVVAGFVLGGAAACLGAWRRGEFDRGMT